MLISTSTIPAIKQLLQMLSDTLSAWTMHLREEAIEC